MYVPKAARRGSDSGIATATVAVVVVLVGALAATAALWVKDAMHHIQRAEVREATLSAARSGVSWAIEVLLADQTPEYDGLGDVWLKGQTFKSVEQATVSVTIMDEGSKINLNTASDAFLQVLSSGALVNNGTQNDPFRVHDLWQLQSETITPVKLARLGQNLTTYTLYPMNTMSESEWVKLLAYSGLTPSTAEAAAREITLGRQARTFHTTDDLLKVAPNLKSDMVKRLAKYLESEGTINVNTAPIEVLSLLAQTVGAEQSKVEALVSRRRSQPYTDLVTVVSLLGVQAQNLPLTVKSRVLRVLSTAKNGGNVAEIDAVLLRTYDTQQRVWTIEVWAWSERIHKP